MRPSQGARLRATRSPRPRLPPPPRHAGRPHRRSPPPRPGHVAAPAFSYSLSFLPPSHHLSPPFIAAPPWPPRASPAAAPPASGHDSDGIRLPLPGSASSAPPRPGSGHHQASRIDPSVRRPPPARSRWTGEVSDLPGRPWQGGSAVLRRPHQAAAARREACVEMKEENMESRPERGVLRRRSHGPRRCKLARGGSHGGEAGGGGVTLGRRIRRQQRVG